MERFILSLRAVLWSVVAVLFMESLGLWIASAEAKSEQIDATIVEWRWDNVVM